jgi:hypothetical protein
VHARLVDPDRLGVEIDHEIAGLNDRLGVTLAAPHDGVNARHQLSLVERLGHVVVGAEAEAFDLVPDAGEAGEDQNRGLDLGDSAVTTAGPRRPKERWRAGELCEHCSYVFCGPVNDSPSWQDCVIQAIEFKPS